MLSCQVLIQRRSSLLLLSIMTVLSTQSVVAIEKLADQEMQQIYYNEISTQTSADNAVLIDLEALDANQRQQVLERLQAKQLKSMVDQRLITNETEQLDFEQLTIGQDDIVPKLNTNQANSYLTDSFLLGRSESGRQFLLINSAYLRQLEENLGDVEFRATASTFQVQLPSVTTSYSTFEQDNGHNVQYELQNVVTSPLVIKISGEERR